MSRFTKSFLAEDSLSCSLTGKYSQSPSISEHRRSQNTHFGRASKEIPSVSNYDDILQFSVTEAIGKQKLSHVPSAGSVPPLHLS